MPVYPINGFEGLTKREWLAGQALAGLAVHADQTKDYTAVLAVKLADLVLKELDKK